MYPDSPRTWTAPERSGRSWRDALRLGMGGGAVAAIEVRVPGVATDIPGAVHSALIGEMRNFSRGLRRLVAWLRGV